jgi:hypothetical protein
MKEDFSETVGTSSAYSDGQLEKKHTITSLESGRGPASIASLGQTGPVVEPHMGLLSSCNMVYF